MASPEQKLLLSKHRHEHAHRHLSDIEKIINDSALDNNTKELSRKIFMKIAGPKRWYMEFQLNMFTFMKSELLIQ
jgi:uncharacterized protein (DUF111 family)